MTVANYLRSDPNRKLPNYVAVNGIHAYDSFQIAGSAYLGAGYEPFRVTAIPATRASRCPTSAWPREQAARLTRADRLAEASRPRWRDVRPVRATMQALDAFESQAANLLTSPDARRAFDLNQEDPRVRDRYGRNAWGQQCLMARRLVEAGVELVTTAFDGPLCGRVAQLGRSRGQSPRLRRHRLPPPTFDQAVTRADRRHLRSAGSTGA